MYDELYQLEEELKKVESCKLEYLPKYGYSSKEEIIQLIKEDISDVKGQIDQNLKLRISKLSSGYTDESFCYNSMYPHELSFTKTGTKAVLRIAKRA